MFTRPASTTKRAARGLVTRLPARAVVNTTPIGTVIDASPVTRAAAPLQPEISKDERLADLRGALDAMAHAALSIAASWATLAARWMTAGASRWEQRAERRRQRQIDDTPMEVMFENFQVFGTPELSAERQAPSAELLARRTHARAQTIEDVPDLELIKTSTAPSVLMTRPAESDQLAMVSWDDDETLRIQLAEEPVATPPVIEFHSITGIGPIDDEIGGWLDEGASAAKKTSGTDDEFERSLEQVELAFADTVERVPHRARRVAEAARTAPLRQPTEFESRMALTRTH